MVTILSGTSRPALPPPRPAALQRMHLRQLMVGAGIVLAVLVAAPAITSAVSEHPQHSGSVGAAELARCWKQAHRSGADPGRCTDSSVRGVISQP